MQKKVVDTLEVSAQLPGHKIDQRPAALPQDRSACIDQPVRGGATQAAGQIRQDHATMITREETQRGPPAGQPPNRHAVPRACSNGLAQTASRAWVADTRPAPERFRDPLPQALACCQSPRVRARACVRARARSCARRPRVQCTRLGLTEDARTPESGDCARNQ
jgi:hypothetical protein